MKNKVWKADSNEIKNVELILTIRTTSFFVKRASLKSNFLELFCHTETA